MQTQDNPNAVPIDGPNPAPIDGHGETVSIANPETREHEQVRMLIIGFSIGMSIAGIFLVYIVLAAAGLLK